MTATEDLLVSTDWLEDHLDDPVVRVVDMRGYVITRPLEPGVDEADYRGAREEYLAGHIPGAAYGRLRTASGSDFVFVFGFLLTNEGELRDAEKLI